MLKNKGLIQRIRMSRTFKGISALLMLSILFEIVQPTVSLALTEGPSQPEVQSFEPIGTTDMVDVFSGDFNYNIPLFNLPGPNGGYPVNLAYHAGSSVDDEASWVGLGWNINAGSLVRNMRGLPDEFMSKANGAEIEENTDFLEVKSDMKQNMTVGFSTNAKFEFAGADISGANFSNSIYYNNYRGLGMSNNASISWGGSDVQGGLGLSMDSDNGIGVEANATLTSDINCIERNHKLGLSFDGNLSIDYSQQASGYIKGSKTFERASSSTGSSMTFARSTFSPSLAFKMLKWNASLSLYTGMETGVAFSGGGGSVFFNTEDFNGQDKVGRKHLVVGYDNMGADISSELYSSDFSRERDGNVTAFSPYLPVSNYTYDSYSSTGQGLSGYFRPKRNDIGRIHDPYMYNTTYGASLSLEIGAGSGTKAGFQVNLSYGNNQQGVWNDNNELRSYFANPTKLYDNEDAVWNENLYYKAHGEQTILDPSDYNYKSALDLVALKFAPKGTGGSGTTMYGGKRHLKAVDFPNMVDSKKENNKQREKRNTTIHNLKNSEVSDVGDFIIKHYIWNSDLNLKNEPSINFDRTTRNSVNIDNHYAGFEVLNEEGATYVYGLPAYNVVDIENTFSTKQNIPNGTYLTDLDLINGEVDYKQYAKGHQYIRKVKKSPYAHSYLLTSVKGADYVDITNDGPTKDDLGYWVKFSYVKKATNFKWRTPYDPSQAFFNQGATYTDEDDKASYSYGEKEMWYMGRMETKTHVAIFKMSERQDMVEAAQEQSNDALTDLTGLNVPLKLDSIIVYDKKSLDLNGENARPLQKIVFVYDYTLCKGAPNSKATLAGKLTLKEIYFTNNGSTRGSLNSYKFNYEPQPIGNLQIPDNHENPDFETGAYDSWGIFKPRNGNDFASNFPYVNQFNQDWNTNIAYEPDDYQGSNLENNSTKAITKKDQDGLASAWCLRSIILPSGGVINVKYESDDYGYVQHKTANQMFKIVALGNNLAADEVFDNEDTDFSSHPEKRRVYFKLEYPIPISETSNKIASKIFSDYVEPIHEENGERYMYFKTKMQLTGQVKDYVSGYLPLEKALMSGELYNFGVALNSSEINDKAPVQNIDGVQCYTHGFITLKSTKKIRKPSEYYKFHPMAIAGWTYMQTNASELLQDQAGFSDDVNDQNLLGKVGAFLNVMPEMISNWGSIKNYCARKEFCDQIILDYSCIRLASPDKIKFGGGHRVKEISINDNWGSSTGGSNNDNRTYGQRYQYTIEENGKMISSGVAAYEPQAGGDENALKYPYFYAEKMNYFTKNNLFAEAPFNEALFPGASVGYRKVTVTSINTDNQVLAKANNSNPGPSGRTSGVTEYMFYTAKEFPTMVEASQLKEENSTLDSYNLLIPIPLVGSLKYNYYHGTQAYKIELNDMHGKPKGVLTYELNNYERNINPITETSYEYQCEPISYMGEQVWKLDNYVSVINNDDNFSPTQRDKLMGVEIDLYTDQRESKSFHLSAGLAFNVDWPPFPFPLPSVWPSYSNTKQLFRTYVTNKVIHRTGILKKTISKDLQSTNESEILAYDEKSGIPLMVKTKNEFGDDFYSYNVPAYYKYDLMGHAYQNIGFSFKTDLEANSNLCYYTFNATNPVNHLNNLVRGDELLVNGKKAYFLGWAYSGSDTKGMIHFPHLPLTGSVSDVEIKVIRSGRRNHYSTIAGNYLTKGTIADNGFSNFTISLDDNTSTSKKAISKNVLSATASLFMDNWRDDVSGNYQLQNFTYYDDRSGRDVTASAETFIGDDVSNPYITGNAGIWRGYKSFTFVGDRKSSAAFNYAASDTDPKLYDDGVFTAEVPLFDWELGMPDIITGPGATTPYSKWEWTNEITRFNSEAYETENVNRLGIYSSALYGYDNSLSIGVGSNASLHEMGVMDFEKLEESVAFGSTMKQYGLNFYNSMVAAPSKLLVTEHQNFNKAFYNNGLLEVTFKFNSTDEKNEFQSMFVNMLAMPYWPSNYANSQPVGNTLENTFGISLVSKQTSNKKGNISNFLNGKFTGLTDVSSTEVKCTFKPYVCSPDDQSFYLQNGSYHFGKLTMLKKRKVANLEPNSYSGTSFIANGTDGMKAHSGKKMMKINGSMMFEQQRICVQKNKPYVLSLWISRTAQDVKTYEVSNLVQIVSINTPNGTFSTLPAVVKYGKVIEGWQKVDLEFIVDASNYSPDNVLAIRFNTSNKALYVDDVRLSPKVGGMKTFVYDPDTYWLKASLNVDNYATFYHYNDQGALTLMKQETEKGIFTVSENRARLQKQ